VQQLVLHRELADAAQGGVELVLQGVTLALLEPRVEAGERLLLPVLEAVDLDAELAGERSIGSLRSSLSATSRLRARLQRCPGASGPRGTR